MAHQERSFRQLSPERNRQELRRKEKIKASLVDGRERGRKIAQVLWITLVLNWAVSLGKIVFGFMTSCMVIVADGFHSFADGTSNIVGLVAVHIAQHPADDDHPYGHHKFETFASVLISLFLFVLAFEVFRKAIEGFFSPMVPQISRASFGVMIVTLAVNLFVAFYERRQGQKLKSDFLVSDSWHTMTDIFLTLGVLAALVGIQRGIPHLDSVVSIAIAIFIVLAAINILRRGLDVLVDKAVIDPKKIEMIARGVAGVQDCHEIRTRGNAHNIYVDLHVLVDGHMSVLASHGLANQVESRIRKEIEGVGDVMVHVEPVSHDHKEVEGS